MPVVVLFDDERCGDGESWTMTESSFLAVGAVSTEQVINV